MTQLQENLERVRANVAAAAEKAGRDPRSVRLLAVSKTFPLSDILEAHEAGQLEFGENRVQELETKVPNGTSDIIWHLIGHLQTNKVKYIIDKVDMIHSVDSMKLAKEIDKRAKAHDKTMDILVQINPAQEESKFGVSIDEAGDLVKEILENCENIRIKGLMSVAPIVEDPRDVKPYFDGVKAKFDELAKIEHPNLDFKCLSMGMSHDFQVAIEAGSNLVRVGSAIFGERDYELYRKQQAEKKAKKQEENR